MWRDEGGLARIWGCRREDDMGKGQGGAACARWPEEVVLGQASTAPPSWARAPDSRWTADALVYVQRHAGAVHGENVVQFAVYCSMSRHGSGPIFTAQQQARTA